MTATLARLNPAALVTLADCEQRIERGLKTFIDVGQALAEIRDSRLYRASHETFEAYCQERWGFSDRRASQFIEAASVVPKILGTGLPAPTVESQARALAKVPEAERADVWREAVERTDGKPTAAAVREVHEERTRPTPTPGPSDAAVTPPVDPGTTPAPANESPVLDPQEPAPAEAVTPTREGGSVTASNDPPQREPDEDIVRDSERRAAVASIRSVLTYLTSRVLKPNAVARQYLIALDDFSAADLRFAAETMAALAALKEQ